MYFGSLYCKQYGPRSDCSLWSSLVRVHIICFSGVHLNICSSNKQTAFSGQKNIMIMGGGGGGGGVGVMKVNNFATLMLA